MRPSEKKDRSSVNGISRTTVTGQIASEPRGCPRSSRVGYPQQREFASAHTRKKSRHNGILSSSPPLCLIPSRLEPVLCRVFHARKGKGREKGSQRSVCTGIYAHEACTRRQDSHVHPLLSVCAVLAATSPRTFAQLYSIYGSALRLVRLSLKPSSRPKARQRPQSWPVVGVVDG